MPSSLSYRICHRLSYSHQKSLSLFAATDRSCDVLSSISPSPRQFSSTTRRRRQHQVGGGHRSGRRRSNNNKSRKQEDTVKIHPPTDYIKKLPKPKERILPPALLAPTASPYVYISQTALVIPREENDENNDENSEPTLMDTSTLFAEALTTTTTTTTNGTQPQPQSYRQQQQQQHQPLFYFQGQEYEFDYFSSPSRKRKKQHEHYPNAGDSIPEVCFLGRSNVGKSSLINSVINKDLCITSKSPGRTQLPYYYGLISKSNNSSKKNKSTSSKQQTTATTTSSKQDAAQGYIVDLPGYGYGMAPKSVVDGWQQDTQEWLLHRRHEAQVLQRLFLLMDARRGDGPNELDRTVMRWLEDAAIPYTIVLTKADRVSIPLVVKQVNDFCLRYASQYQYHDEDNADDDDGGGGGGGGVAQSPVVHVTSSKQGWGIPELRLSIETEFFHEDDEDGLDDDEDYDEYDDGHY